jgi:hypothetical protein
LARTFQTLQSGGDNRIDGRRIGLRDESKLRRGGFHRGLLATSPLGFLGITRGLSCAPFLYLAHTLAQLFTPLRAGRAPGTRKFYER